MDTATRQRNIVVSLDPVDCIFVVAALVELETRYSGIPYRGPAERVRNVREAIEKAVYGEPLTESEQRLMDGNR